MGNYTDAEINGLLRETKRLLNRSWYEIREQTKTDGDERLRRAEELCAATRRILERDRSRREQRRIENRTREEAAESYVLADLRSTNEGERLGRRWAHDAFGLAASLGINVQRVPLAKLQDPRRPSVEIRGRLFNLPGGPIVQLADSLKGRELLYTLAHEIGHFLDLPDERLCDQFAAAFLRIDDSDTPAARWKAMDDECIRRARQDSIARGKALAAASRH